MTADKDVADPETQDVLMEQQTDDAAAQHSSPEELEELQDAALSIHDVEPPSSPPTIPQQPASSGVGSAGRLEGHPDPALSGPGTVISAPPPFDWAALLGASAQHMNAATTVSSAGFAFARNATAFGLNLAKRITQGLVALPAIAVDGALTGTAPGNEAGTPSVAQIAHSTVGGFFDLISTVALGGIDVTSALTGAGLGAAGSGLEGVRRSLGSEVLRSLSEFSGLVKREWNAQDDLLPPGGIPAYSFLGITQALSTWVCIQLVTRQFQEQRMLRSLTEIDLKAIKEQIQQEHEHELQSTHPPAGAQNEVQSDTASLRSEVRITSDQRLTGEQGSIIGAEIGSKGDIESGSILAPGPLSDVEAIRGMQRFSKLVLGVYGGIALAWLGSMPSNPVTAGSQPSQSATEPVFSAEEEFMAKERAEFLEAAMTMDLHEEEESEQEQQSVPGAFTCTPPVNAGSAAPGTPSAAGATITSTTDVHASGSPDSTRPQGTTYTILDLWSGQHDNHLFHRTANLADGTAQEGSYDEHEPRVPASGKARPSKPRYYVVTDHPRKTIILVLRGTLSVGDLAADLTCESVPFTFDPSLSSQSGAPASVGAEAQSNAKRTWNGFADSDGPDLVHEGMYITAKEIGEPGRPVNRAVSRALNSNDGYALEITGHSLGAGVASILAMMWGDPSTGLTFAGSGLPQGRRVHAFCFGVPCVATEALAQKVSTLVTSHVFSYDLVSRLSLGAIQDIRNACAWLCYEDTEASRRQPGSDSAHDNRLKMTSLMRRAFEYQAGRLESDAEAKADTESDFLSLRKTLEANMNGVHLFPPGKVLYSLSETDLLPDSEGPRDRLFVVKDNAGSLKNVFGQIIFSRSMLSCHMPSAYDQALHRLPKG